MTTTSRALHAVVISAAAFTLTASGCATKRPELSPEALIERGEGERAASIEAIREGLNTLVRRLAREARLAEADPSATEPILDVLMLSGGADYGAFGAGFLEGWSSVQGPMGMPDFDIVTGVSTGALIAPFVATGRRGDLAAVARLYAKPSPDWMRFDPTEALNPGAASLSDIRGLRRDLERSVDAAMLQALASRADEGFLVLVSATNLDVGALRVFDVGAESRRALHAGTPSRVHDVLLASAAVPGMFPPVILDDNLYVDGGITSNILSRSAAEVDESLDREWRAHAGETPFPRTRLWIVVNNQLATPHRTVQPRWSGIARRSISVLVRSHTRASLRDLVLAVQAGGSPGLRVEVRYVAIPHAWKAPSDDLFDPKVMHELVELGRRLGSDPTVWRSDLPQE